MLFRSFTPYFSVWRAFFLLFFSTSLYASTLHLSISGYPSRLNPIIATDSTSSTIANWVFSGLLTYDKDANIVGDLAESFEFETPTRLRFHLKQNLTWHDGAPLTAHDVKFTFDALHSPKLFSPYTSAFRSVDRVEVIDDYTVLVHYKNPYFKALESWMMSIIPKHILENEEDLMTSSFNQHPIGTNSYTLKGFEVSKDITLDAFKAFKPKPANIDHVIYRYVQDPATEFLMLKAGQLDLGNLTPMQLERQLTPKFHDTYRIIEQPDQSFTYLGFNLKRPPFNDLRVRRALSYAIDRQELVDILYFGHGTVCHGPFLKGAVGFNPHITSPEQNLTKAKALLKEAGFTDKNPLRFTIKTHTGNPIRKYAAQILQHQLSKAGVDVKLIIMEWQAFLSRAVHGRDFDTILLGWALPLMPDPYNVWHSDSDKKGGFNFVGFHHPEVDRLITESESIVDRKMLNHNFQRIFELINHESPYLFLFIPNRITAVKHTLTPIIPSIVSITHNKEEWRITP